MATIEQAIASADVSRQRLAKLDRQLQEEIDAIDFTAFKEGRSLTANEVEQRKKWRATQGEILDEFKVLAFFTAQRLDESDEVAQLLHRLEIINTGLQDDLERLKQIEKFATIAAQVADSIAKTAERLASIL